MKANKRPSILTRIKSLDPAFLTFLRMQACYTSLVTIMGIFLNTFLLKALGDQKTVMVYNMILAAVQPFAMVLACRMIRKVSPKAAQGVSFGLYALCFLCLAVLGEGAAAYYILFAAVLSTSAGFFYTVYTLQIVSLTDDANLDLCTGLQTMLSSAIGLVLPLLSGTFLAAFSGFTGYRVLFGAALALAGMALFFSLRIPRLRGFDYDPRPCFTDTARAILHTAQPRRMMLMTVFAGIKEGTFSFIITTLIYRMIKNEAFVGLTSSLGSVAAVLAAGVYGAVVRPRMRGKSVIFTTVFVSCICAMLYFRMDPVTLLLFHLAVSFSTPFIVTAQVNTYFSVVQHVDALAGKGAETHSMREMFYAAGRILGILILMVMPDTPAGQVTALLILLLSQLVSGHLVSVTQKELKI